MASGRKRPPRYSFDIHFVSEEEKEVFLARLKSVRQLLTPAESCPIDNCSLLNVLFDAAEGRASQPTSQNESGSIPSGLKSFVRDNGK